MDNLLKFVSCAGLFIICEVEGMDFPECWKNILDRTKANTLFYKDAAGYSEDAENALGGAETRIDWEQVKLAAQKGNSLAQYVHSQHLFALSRSLFNGERRRMRFDAYMYLLIAAVKGEFPQAIDAFNYAVDFTHKIPVFEEAEDDNKVLEWIFSEASKLSKK